LKKCWFSIAMLNSQRVTLPKKLSGCLMMLKAILLPGYQAFFHRTIIRQRIPRQQEAHAFSGILAELTGQVYRQKGPKEWQQWQSQKRWDTLFETLFLRHSCKTLSWDIRWDTLARHSCAGDLFEDCCCLTFLRGILIMFVM
jgi:hypothetical protein